jgi:ABC-2 type transport system ATP-binding protein
MSIQVESVSKFFGAQQALKEVSFSLKIGEVVGFLGPNGAGKSTMMKILTGFIPSDSGVAQVCGLEVGAHLLEVRKKIGYLPEHNPLYLDMFVYEFLHFVAGLYGIEKKAAAVDEMVERVGLRSEAHKKIGQLSKGYRQRVGLAQAMMHRPEVLILDEPTTGLDPNQIDEIRGLIKEVGRSHTVLMSTHIMQEVEAICDRVLIINKGQLVADTPVSELTRLIGDFRIIKVEFDREADLEQLALLPRVVKVDALGRSRYLLHCREDIRDKLQRFAMEKGLVLLTLSLEETKLEDVFRRLTKASN